MKSIEIDGNTFSNLNEFYIEISSKFSNNLNWFFGANLDAFNDVLRGGFGVHEIDEKYHLIWLNSRKSKTELKEFQTLIDVITENKNITLFLK